MLATLSLSSAYGLRRRVLASLALWPLLSLAALPAQASVGMTELAAGDLPVTLVYPSDAPETTLKRGDFGL